MKRSDDYRDARDLQKRILSGIFTKKSGISWKFCTSDERADTTYATKDAEDWDNKLNQPAIDTMVWKNDDIHCQVRMRVCIVPASDNPKHLDMWKERPDYPIPTGMNEKQLYEYMSVNDYHFCVISFLGKDPKHPRRFIAGRMDDIPFKHWFGRNKQGRKKGRHNHMYTRVRAILTMVKPVGEDYKNLITAVTKLIEIQRLKNGNTKG